MVLWILSFVFCAVVPDFLLWHHVDREERIKKKEKKLSHQYSSGIGCLHVSSFLLWTWILKPSRNRFGKKTECFLNVVFSPFCLVTNATRGLVNGFSSSNTYSACNPHSLDAHYCFKYNSSKRVQTRSRTETQRRGKKGGRVRERGVFEVRLSGAMFGTKGEQWGE